MKIGIMTFWDSNENYGQLIQCYALQKYLRDAGHDVYLIRYDNFGDGDKPPIWRKVLKAFNLVKLFRYLRNKIVVVKWRKELDKRNFNEFRNKYIKQSEKIYYSYDELKKDPQIADIYIAGSDQIWNPVHFPSIERQIRAFFLDFGNRTIRRISYAASFGKGKLIDDFINIAVPLLKKFDYISVREESGLRICKQYGIRNAECVRDPTILLNTDQYRELYIDEKLEKPCKQYCFLYFLGNQSSFYVKHVYDWAKNKNLEVVFIDAHTHQKWSNNKITHATIPQWIYLLEHAEYVLTNSYHCILFSIIFKRKFAVLPLNGNIIEMDDRFTSIFKLFGIENRFINNDFSLLDNDIDWQLTSEKLQEVRNTCKLKKLLNEFSS